VQSWLHWAKGTIAQGMVKTAITSGRVRNFITVLCSFLTGIVLMLATPASTSAQARVALTDLMAARVLPLPFERSKGSLSSPRTRRSTLSPFQALPVVTPAARANLAVKTPGDRPDPIAAIFSNVREHICNGRLRLSPPESTPLPPCACSSVFKSGPFLGKIWAFIFLAK